MQVGETVMANNRIIGVNEGGRRVGEHHHRALFTDDEIELMRQLRDLCNPDGSHQWSYGMIAKCFETSKGTVHDICSMRRRNHFVAKFKTIKVRITPQVEA